MLRNTQLSGSVALRGFRAGGLPIVCSLHLWPLLTLENARVIGWRVVAAAAALKVHFSSMKLNSWAGAQSSALMHLKPIVWCKSLSLLVSDECSVFQTLCLGSTVRTCSRNESENWYWRCGDAQVEGKSFLFFFYSLIDQLCFSRRMESTLEMKSVKSSNFG